MTLTFDTASGLEMVPTRARLVLSVTWLIAYPSRVSVLIIIKKHSVSIKRINGHPRRQLQRCVPKQGKPTIDFGLCTARRVNFKTCSRRREDTEFGDQKIITLSFSLSHDTICH